MRFEDHVQKEQMVQDQKRGGRRLRDYGPVYDGKVIG